MKFNKQELRLMMELVADKLSKVENELSIQQDMLFDAIERGEETEEINYRINELDELLGNYAEIYNKLEALKVGVRYA